MAHIVKCRVCKRQFDTDVEPDWLMPSVNYYYHTKCYHDWLNNKAVRSVNAEFDDAMWRDMLKDYLYKDLKIDVDWAKVMSQLDNFTSPNAKTKMTLKGIYFAVIYFYEIQHGDVKKAQGGIGIVSSIYMSSCEYWANREQQRAGTIEGIMQQMASRANRATLVLRNNNRSQVKKIVKYNLEDI